MDQLKVFLAMTKKYYFWIVFVIIMLVAVICWWMATGSLAEKFKARKTKLEGDFKSVMIQRNHPNQNVINWIDQQNNQLKQSVFVAWEALYREQKSKNPFPSVLGEDFKAAFEALKPKEELATGYRDRYQNFIMLYLPSLKKLIDVRHPADDSGAEKEAGAAPIIRAPGMPTIVPGIGGNNADNSKEMVGTVDWNNADFVLIQERFNWKERPTTFDILMAQEDLWVYEAMLNIIKNTNEGATGYATASVKRIDALQIGRDAASSWKDAEDPVFRISAASSMTIGKMIPPTMPGMPGAPGASEEQTRRALIEGRYVDDKGQALAYDAEFPYAKHPYAEFKMMPIRMKLLIDQRRLPQLLVECANSSMPIHVHRVRLVKEPGSPVDLSGGGGVMAGPKPTSFNPMSGGAGNPMGNVSELTEGGPLDIPVEIHGVIYIYNPPDRERVGTGTASEKAGEEGNAEGVRPAAATNENGPATPAAKPNS